MKKWPFPAALLCLGVMLSGCPVYDSGDNYCYNSADCAAGYVCDGYTNQCAQQPTTEPATCRRPSDCDTNETCSRFGTCTSGDCHFSSVGCVRGYECSPDSGRWQCVKAGSVDVGGAPSAGAPSAQGGEPTDAAGAGG